MEFHKAPDIQKKINALLEELDFPHVMKDRIFCFRSYGTTSRAIARIWNFPTIWQMALDTKPGYCIEVIGERFDRQSEIDQTKTLIHELLHIPKTFSGALLPHRGRGRVRVDRRTVEKIYKKISNF